MTIIEDYVLINLANGQKVKPHDYKHAAIKVQGNIPANSCLTWKDTEKVILKTFIETRNNTSNDEAEAAVVNIATNTVLKFYQ